MFFDHKVGQRLSIFFFDSFVNVVSPSVDFSSLVQTMFFTTLQFDAPKLEYIKKKLQNSSSLCKIKITFFSSEFLLPLQILHISDADVRETKMLGSAPIILVMVSAQWHIDSLFFSFLLSVLLTVYPCFQTPFQFRTQEIHCIRDKEGQVTEGGQVGYLLGPYVAVHFVCMYFLCVVSSQKVTPLLTQKTPPFSIRIMLTNMLD